MLADPRLSKRAREVMEASGSTRLHVSAVSALEIANKVRIGKLDLARPVADGFSELCARAGLHLLDLSAAHALLAGRLTGAPRDPFDRLIAAQAIAGKMPVLSIDPAFEALGAERVW